MLNKIKLLNINFGPRHCTAHDVLVLLLNLLGIEVIELEALDSLDDVVIIYVNEYSVFWGITRASFHVKLTATEFF